MTKSIFLTFAIFLYMFHTANAQSTGDAVILMQGKVLDRTGKPVGTTIFFENQNGKKIPCKSNASDGLYQQILTPGLKYFVYFKDYIETGGDLEFELPLVKTYTELSRSFTVGKIEEGMELLKANVFKSNEWTLFGSYADYFATLKSFMATNLNLGVNITISSRDCFFKTKTTKESYQDKKGKTKYKKVTITQQQQAEELIHSRISALKDYFSEIKFPEKRITWYTDISMASSKPLTKSKAKDKKSSKKQETVSTYPNLIVSVGKIKKL